MIFDYLFYYIFKFFKLFKSDDDMASFKSIIVLSIVAYTNVMLLLLIIRAFDLIMIPIIGTIETVVLVSLPFSVLYFIYGYKKKYKDMVKKIEAASKKQKIIFAIISLIYVILSFSLPFIFGNYYKVSLLS
ncbi:MAG: hypothetical protein CVV25_08900 [Ignavibacteriae bacterium HGW-Ignavibacteriae-4]|nr:MAG: hypothetical protein CVV25_08900 [Ignavibacteriae bacterium HGW-Ignavibacteriae-4]